MRTIAPLLIASTLTFVASAVAEPSPVRPIQPVHPVQPHPGLRNIPLVAQCPDPAASVEFRLVRRYDNFRGQVEITAKVQNRGGVDYVSGANQQMLLLYEVPQGGDPRLIATVPFQNLASNAGQQVSFTRDWDRTSPAEGEFTPSYRAVISYDPDIRIDANPKNDDCRSANDRAERSGNEVNTILMPPT